MFCKGCGKSVDTSVAVCPHCGRDADSLSGGTGFWDLLERTSEHQLPEERHGWETRVPSDGAQYEFGDRMPAMQFEVHEGTRRMTHDSGIVRWRQNPAKKQSVPLKISLLAIGIGVLVCALIMATALVLAQCLYVGEEGKNPETTLPAASVAHERSNVNDEGDDEEGLSRNQGNSLQDLEDSDDDDGRVAEQS